MKLFELQILGRTIAAGYAALNKPTTAQRGRGRPALFIFLTFCSLLSAVDATRPNVLLIVSEDNGQELGCYGEPYVQTPVLDKLAAEGVLFKNAYVAQAGCSQSRASFLTGLYPHQNGQIGLATWKFRMYDENTPNIVRSLKEAGYRTGIIGKLHVNPESAFPFDFKAIPSSNFSRKNQGNYAKEAKRFMTAGDAPFFLSINYPDAHRPFTTQIDGLPEKPLTGVDVPPSPTSESIILNSVSKPLTTIIV